MMNMLKSLWNFVPGREREAAPAPESEAMPDTLSVSVAEEPPARPRRQIVDPAEIAAAAAPEAPASDAVPEILNAAGEVGPADESDPELLSKVIEAVSVVRDPEIPVNLFELGLIYELVATKEGRVFVEMTLTTPHCPSAADLPRQVEEAALSVEGIKDAKVKLVFTPPWDQSMMSEEARLELGMF